MYPILEPAVDLNRGARQRILCGDETKADRQWRRHEIGVLSGVPVRPDEIQQLMNQMNQPKLAHVLPADEEGGDDQPDG
jgi:hypothetical protein